MITISVLIVDDQKIVRDAVSGLLEFGHDVQVVGEACDGVEALDLASHLQPDVIVMDISMPRMNGLEATRAIREKWPTMSVILVTGLAVTGYQEIAQLCGAHAFLAKESMSAQLLSTIRRIVRVA